MWRCRPLLRSYGEKALLRATPAPSIPRPNHRRLLGPIIHFATAAATDSAASTPDSSSPDGESSSSALPPSPPPIVWTTHLLSADQIHKVDTLFHKILWLDMMETAILVEAINTQLGKNLSTPQRTAIQRQMDRLGDGDGGAGATPAEGEEAPPVDEGPKLVDVKLTGFDAAQKIKVIKEVRAILGLGLKEAKELVEAAPKTLQKGLKPEQAEELRQKLEAAGAQVEVS